MMCEHEWDEQDSNDTYCTVCGKSKNEVRLEQQLTTANANNKALREENELLRHKSAGHDTTMLRAELTAANARIAELEKQNKRMRDALREIVNVTSKCLSHEEMKDKMKHTAKAALEVKP